MTAALPRTSDVHKPRVGFCRVPGWYWIDPNLGVATDAIEVWCNLSNGQGQTCVYPQSNSQKVIKMLCLIEIFNIVHQLLVKSRDAAPVDACRFSEDGVITARVYYVQIKPNAWRKENGEDQWFSEFAEGFRVSLMRAIRSRMLMTYMYVLQYRYTDVRSVILYSVSLGNYHLLNKLYNIWLRFLLLCYDDPRFICWHWHTGFRTACNPFF